MKTPRGPYGSFPVVFIDIVPVYLQLIWILFCLMVDV